MGVLSIEFADPTVDPDPCPCCGGKTTRLTRYIYSDGDAHGVYYATLSDKHPEKLVSALVSLGKWGEGSQPKDRVAFAIQIRLRDEQYQVSLMDAKHSPWYGEKYLDKILDRNAALVHPWKSEVFHITDHIAVEDKEIRGYLE